MFKAWRECIMSKIVFFCIPAYGHTNPTIPLIKELTSQGHKVRYYSFDVFKDRIEAVNAEYISCDKYLPPVPKNFDKIVGKDFAALIEMVTAATISLDEKVCKDLKKLKPDCIVSDSICFWGKLFAFKLNIPYICSTTTFAFNNHTARLMKQSFGDLIRMLFGIPRINKCMNTLKKHGYNIKSFISIIQNDNETDTIVYTSKEFQPMSETFSDKYAFIGPIGAIESAEPLINEAYKPIEKIYDKLVYISLGTVNNKNNNFYKSCLEAFADKNIHIIMSVGENTSIEELGIIPKNFTVERNVNQIKVLKAADAFVTHCGMNSVSEALYYKVPLILFPQQSEQRAVADRVSSLGAGIYLNDSASKSIYDTVEKVLSDNNFYENAVKISAGFKKAGGCAAGVNKILEAVNQQQRL